MFIIRSLGSLRSMPTKLSIPCVRQIQAFSKQIEEVVQNKVSAVDAIEEKSLANKERRRSVLDPIESIESADLLPNFVPSFNFAAYVNKSELLQEFIKLGVDLSKIEKKKGLVPFVLKLDFERDVKNHLIFLNDVGVEPSALGNFITKNPLIFKEDIDDLRTRINYLQAKKFDQSQISRIITKNPFWLMFTTKRIDNRLGFFQVQFSLTGNETRLLATSQPRLITYQLQHVRDATFCIREEMGFSNSEVKSLLLNKPKLWMLTPDELIERFDYVHKTMNLSHKQIAKSPEILTSRQFRVQQRHKFLELLGKAQYDPTKDLYVSLKSLVEGTDLEFVNNVARSNISTYDNFLRTL